MTKLPYYVSPSFEETLLDIADALPHGSGIDCDWTSYITKRYVSFQNSYHCMDKYGGYDGFADFTVKIPLIDGCMIWDEFILQFNGTFAQYQNRKYDLRSYLEDTIWFYLNGFFTPKE